MLHIYLYQAPRLRMAGAVPPLNPLNAELNPICHLLALLGAHRILHVSRIRVKHVTSRRAEGQFDITSASD